MLYIANAMDYTFLCFVGECGPAGLRGHLPDGGGQRLRMSSPTRIQDVARIAGVSTATVSRALHNPGLVTRETREKVQRAVAETGYAGNAMARNLRRMETRMIVVLVPNIGNPFFSEILSGIESVATANGYSILIGNTDNDPDRERTFADHVRGYQADGMLLLNGQPPYFATPRGAALAAPGQPPVVVLCERLPDHDFPTVRIDNVEAARDATAHLVALGHRWIAHVKGPEGNILTIERLQGYDQALTSAGLPRKQGHVQAGDFSIASGQRAAARLMALERPPTAIFCANDEMAIGVIAALKAAGHAVPGDVSVVGFDDLPISGCYDPALTTVHQPRRLIGETGMQIMVDRLVNAAPGSSDRVMPTELIVRASSAAPHMVGA